MALLKLNPPFTEKFLNTDFSRFIREDYELNWRIESSTFLDDKLKPGDALRSPRFPKDNNAEFEWQIVFYPYDNTREKSKFCPIFLCLIRKTVQLPVSIVSNIFAKAETNSVIASSEFETMLTKSSSGSGNKSFLERSVLLDLFTHEKYITICAKISAHYEAISCYTSNFISEKHLLSKYGKLLENGTFSDIVLYTEKGETEFKVHRSILASQSKVFSAMFSNDMSEKSTGRVVIKDISSSTMKDLLQFIYNCKVQFKSVEATINLLAASDKYDLPDLKLQCAEYLSVSLNEENACEILLQADTYKLTDLKSLVLEYMYQNKSKFANQEKFRILLKQNPRPLADFISKLINRGIAEESVKNQNEL